MNFKTIVIFIKLLTSVVLLQTFGKLMHDLAHKYEGVVSISDFRKWEKLSIEKRKAELDIKF